MGTRRALVSVPDRPEHPGDELSSGAGDPPGGREPQSLGRQPPGSRSRGAGHRVERLADVQATSRFGLQLRPRYPMRRVRFPVQFRRGRYRTLNKYDPVYASWRNLVAVYKGACHSLDDIANTIKEK